MVANALDARQHGASIHPRLRCIVAERERDRWRLALESEVTGEPAVVLASILVNAAGPEAANVLDHVIHANQRAGVRLTRHSQIVARRKTNSHIGYALPAADGRIVHAVPHEPGFMLIGSAESRHERDPADATATRRDLAYLADVANQYFHQPIEPADIVQHRVCITAMPEDPAAASGDHAVIVETAAGSAPLVTVFGGELTTHRLIAEEVVDRLARFRKVGAPWTARASLPGGNFPPGSGAAALCHALSAAYPFLAEDHAYRLAMTYGTRAPSILTGARAPEDLGPWFGADLTGAEVDFLRGEEWAMTAEDVLWRRTRVGLSFTAGEAEALAGWMAERAPVPAGV